MRAFTLIVIDDDDLVLQTVKMATPKDWVVQAGQSLKDVLTSDRVVQAALVDMHLSGDTAKSEGLSLIRKLRAQDPHMEIIGLSGDSRRELMDEALDAGANSFIPKPISTHELRLKLEKIEQRWLLQGAWNRQVLSQRAWLGSSARAREVQRQMASLRGEQTRVLIEGESGTGKEIVARWLNAQEGDRPFMSINMAALPENLVESELFGHVRGSFTGAHQNKMGIAEAAHGGDLFLDEIEAASPMVQSKLLRFAESGEIRRIGAQDVVHVQCRLISATNQPLEKLVQQGKFREDLYWRLNGFRIELPPLRERREDILELARDFLERDSYRTKSIEPDAAETLMEYNWPGNVRELRRVCEQLLITAPLPVIRRQDVLGLLRSASTPGPIHVDLGQGLAPILEDFERRVLSYALEKHPNIEECAVRLKLSRSSLYKKLKDLGLRGEAHE